LRVTWDGHAIAGVSRLTTLSWSAEVIEHRDGADPENSRKLPGRTSYAPVVLEREITGDREFAAWADAVTQDRPEGMGAGDPRKDLHIELLDEVGEVILAYTLYLTWVSAYQAVAVPEATQYPVAMETIKIEFESWQRHPPAT
jgi:phage tail-like protein